MWFVTRSFVGAQNAFAYSPISQVCVDSVSHVTYVDALYEWDSSTSVEVCAAPPSPSPSASVAGDPHLSLAYGGQADFRGKHGKYYNFLSAPGVSMNIGTDESLFKLKKLTVNGTFVTIASIVLRTSFGEYLNLTYSADQLNEVGQSPHVVYATCRGERFTMGPSSKNRCDDIEASIDWNTLTVLSGQWVMKVSGRPIYDRISGPHHRLDLSAFPSVKESEFGVEPHGLVGQSFDGTGVPRYGRLDQYPNLEVPGTFATSSMAEGAIAGDADDYLVDSKFSTAFKYSVFN